MQGTRRLPFARLLLSLCAGALLLTCKEAAGPVLADHVVVSGPATLHVGQAALFTALPIGSHGDTLVSRPVVWFSGDTTIATVTPLGFVTTRAVGDVGINASADGKVGFALLSVQPAPVARVDVTPARDSFFVDDSLQLLATLRDDGGRLLTQRAISWASSDTTRAVVSATGLVNARSAGSVAITATSEGQVGGAFLMAQQRAVVLDLPDSLTLHRYEQILLIPSLRSATGTHLAGRPIAWTTFDSAVVTVSPTGVITPQGIGTGRAAASSIGLADTMVIHVIPERVFAVTTPFIGDGDDRLFVGRSEPVVAKPVDVRSFDVEGESIVWTSSDEAIATVTPDSADSWHATVTAVGRGFVTIVALSGGKQNSKMLEADFPITTWRFSAESLFLPVGVSRPLVAVGSDTIGTGLAVAPVTPTIIDSGIVSASGGGNSWTLSGLQPGRARVSGLAFDQYPISDTITVIVVPRAQDRLSWDSNDRVLANYTTVAVGLALSDSAGDPVSSSRTVFVTSTDTNVVVLDDTLYAGVTAGVVVTLHTRTRGSAQLVARSDSLLASLPLIVEEIRPYRITLSPSSDTLAQGDTLRFSTTTLGTDLLAHDYPVSWSSSDENTAQVSTTGLVTAMAGGTATITARAGSVSHSAPLWVRSLAAPTVTTVTPDPILPGSLATIAGSGFDPDPAANLVTVDGVVLAVSGASDTLLTVAVPPFGAFPCDSTHDAGVTVASGGRYTFARARLSPAPPVQFSGPGPRQLTGDEARCFKLVQLAAADLLVSIVNTAPSPDSTAAFRIGAMTLTSTGVATQARVGAPTVMSSPPAAPPEIRFRGDSLSLATRRHRGILEANRAFMKRAGPPAPLLRAARGLRPQLSVSARVGDLVTIRIPQIEYPDFCSRYLSVVARLVYNGQHILMFEDVQAPLARSMDDVFNTVGYQVDTGMWDVVTANFGNPLALDSLLDGNSKVAILFSPTVNALGVGGFVASCDFFPETAAPSSNTGEIIFAQVPTAFGQGFQSYTPQAWSWLTPTVLVHELKHVTAFAERLSGGAPPEDVWLEEATAVVSQELWARMTYGTTWKGNATYASTLYCDVRPTWPACLGRPYAMFDAFALLYEFGGAHETRTPLGPLTFDDATFYGSGWSLVRWTIDRYAPSESAFLRALTSEPDLVGVANLGAQAGRPFSEIVPQWALAMRVDGVAQANAPQFPSWNLNSIFAGMAQDFPNDFPSSQPVAERPLNLNLGWDFGLTVPGGTFVLFRQQFPPLNQLLQIVGPTGGLLSEKMIVHLMRFP